MDNIWIKKKGRFWFTEKEKKNERKNEIKKDVNREKCEHEEKWRYIKRQF